MTKLQAAPRTEVRKKLATLRKEGKVPAIVYGAKVAATPITLNSIEFVKVYRETGETGLIKLVGLPEEHEVLIQDIAFDVVKGHPIHVDFYAVERGKEMEVDVPLEFVGESPAAKAGAQIVKILHEVEVRTTPGNIPSEFEIDLSVLKAVGDQIHVSDITLPEGVVITNEPDEVVALIQEHEEEEEEEAGEIDMESIEVEKKGKEETEESEEEAK